MHAYEHVKKFQTAVYQMNCSEILYPYCVEDEF